MHEEKVVGMYLEPRGRESGMCAKEGFGKDMGRGTEPGSRPKFLALQEWCLTLRSVESEQISRDVV